MDYKIFRQWNSNLPTFINFRYDWYCMSEHKFKICDKAIIKIQDWDVSNIISGAIYSDITPNINGECIHTEIFSGSTF